MPNIETKKLLIVKNITLAEQWHPTLNTDLNLDSIYANSGKKAWWKCPVCNHEWKAQIASRNANNRGCPNCAGKIVNNSNSLVFLHPLIAQQYHPTKNTEPVENFTTTSHKKVWWLCEKNHEWEAIIGNRVRQSNGCPYCSGRYPTKENNLKTKYPEIAAEFNLFKNYPASPETITPHTPQKFWWKCEKNHEWQVSANSRVRKNKIQKCPYCAGKKATHDNHLGITHPHLIKQYHPTLNNLTIMQIRHGSPKKVWWLCNQGHQWEATISSRTRIGREAGCPECSSSPKTSKIEKQIRNHLETTHTLKHVGQQYNTTLITNKGTKEAVDIYGEHNGHKVVVEYDSWWWHSGAGGKKGYDFMEERDTRKTQLLLNSNYIVIRIREARIDKTLPFLKIEHPNFHQINWNQKEGINNLCQHIQTFLQTLQKYGNLDK